MSPNMILGPMAGMFLLTAVVFVYMFVLRIGEIRSSGRMPRTRADLDKYSPRAVNSSNNFQNLFELPVIFYACVLGICVTNQTDQFYGICAHGFLLFRIIHSAIHCTYNNIMHRFSAYFVASIFLWVMVIRFTMSLMLHGGSGG